MVVKWGLGVLSFFPLPHSFAPNPSFFLFPFLLTSDVRRSLLIELHFLGGSNTDSQKKEPSQSQSFFPALTITVSQTCCSMPLMRAAPEPNVLPILCFLLAGGPLMELPLPLCSSPCPSCRTEVLCGRAGGVRLFLFVFTRHP